MRSFTPFVSDDEVMAIGCGLVMRTLPKSKWTHSAHFAAALWMLRCHPEIDVGREMPELIRAYNEATGVENTDSSGYHETITQASLRAARDFRTNNAHLSLHETCNELMSSPLGSSDWLLAYWTRQRLFSAEARKAWIAPDIQPLPF
jgi:hypothetical protein